MRDISRRQLAVRLLETTGLSAIADVGRQKAEAIWVRGPFRYRLMVYANPRDRRTRACVFLYDTDPEMALLRRKLLADGSTLVITPIPKPEEDSIDPKTAAVARAWLGRASSGLAAALDQLSTRQAVMEALVRPNRSATGIAYSHSHSQSRPTAVVEAWIMAEQLQDADVFAALREECRTTVATLPDGRDFGTSVRRFAEMCSRAIDRRIDIDW